MRAIDIGNVVDAEVRPRIGLERQRHHSRSKVGAADADIDDVGELLAAVAADAAVPHQV